MATGNIPKLRPYQQKGVDEARKLLNEHKRVMLQCPTGGGKTEMAIVLVKEWLERTIETAKGPSAPRVLWLTHRAELRRQTGSRFEKYGVQVLDLSETAPKERRLTPGKLCIVAAQIRQLDMFAAQVSEHDLLVADEAHHAPSPTWTNLIKNWPGLVLGLTATPWRLNEKEGFTELFNQLVTGPTIDELANQGYLSDYILYAPKDADTRVVGGRIQYGDYAPDDIDVRVLATDKIIEMWHQHKPNNARTLWYVPTKEAALQLSATLERYQLQHAVILADTDPEERRPALSRFATGSVTHIVNVMTLMEGIDAPEANCIVFARPTKSLVVFLQAMGRGLRPQEHKRAVLLDLGHSYNDFGVYPFGYIDWSLDPRGPQVTGEAPMKSCPSCDAVMYTGYRVCPACGLRLGEECTACRRFTFYTNSGYGGEERLFLAVVRNHFERNGYQSTDATFLDESQKRLRDIKYRMLLRSLNRRIKFDGGLKCVDCTEVALINQEFPWELGPVNGYKAVFQQKGANSYSVHLTRSKKSSERSLYAADDALQFVEKQLLRFAQSKIDGEKSTAPKRDVIEDICTSCGETVNCQEAGCGGEDRQLLMFTYGLEIPEIVLNWLQARIRRDGGIRCRKCAVTALQKNQLLWRLGTIYGYDARVLAHNVRYQESRAYRFDVLNMGSPDGAVLYTAKEWALAYGTFKSVQAKMKDFVAQKKREAQSATGVRHQK